MMLFKMIFWIMLPLVCALPWDGPKPTATAELRDIELFKREHYGVAPVVDWSPIPTMEPQQLFEGYSFWKRQSGVTSSATYSSYTYNTCGFWDGSTRSYYTSFRLLSG
jgi:hypothetical protein